MSRAYEIHVIANTHWDREWLYNFQETRLMLVELLDLLLEVFEAEPAYKSFLLDGQSVPVEDYLELRPQHRARIQKHVADGRLLIGPWYTLPECFSVNGESLVRNLTYGHRVGQEFGGVMKVGHTAFSYGQNSQMPQIYMGFGIDVMLFYHGVSHDEVANEFIFEGADGTRILGSQMSSGARYNFYHNVYRPAVFGKAIADRMYEWREGGLPFHLCREARAAGHHMLLDPVRGFDRERARECIAALRDREAAVATTKYLAFMMGHDSSIPDLVELELIKEARKILKDDTIFHSRLPDLMAKVKKAAKNLTVLKGERRTPVLMNQRMHLYSDVLSSRTRVKRLNALAEQALQRWAEPFAALAWRMGAEYPSAALDLAWKTLLKSQPHDSISGSGVDDIERDVRDRLRQTANLSDSIMARSLQHIQRRIDNSDAERDDVLLTVFNASPQARSEVVTAAVDVPRTSAMSAFQIVACGTAPEAARNPAPVQVVTRKPHHAVVNHAADATYMLESEQVTFHFEAKDIPAFGYATFRLAPFTTFGRGTMVCGHQTMENEHLRVQINGDGTLTLSHKASGQVYEGLHFFEDGGEVGNAWMHIEPGADRIVSSIGSPVTISLEENGPLLARFRIDCHMTIPAQFDEANGDAWQRLDGGGSASRRSDETVPLLITSHVTLRRGARSVDITTRFTNAARYHRLRVLFPTRRKTRTCHVETPFDVVERPATHPADSPWQAANATFPMQRFVDVSDQRGGLAIINDGLREYEITPGEERAVALTLVRAYEIALTTVSKRWERHPEMELSQCQGEHEFRYALYPHTGSWDRAGVFSEVERLAVPLEMAQVGPHAGDLPQRLSLLSVTPPNAVVSALKQSEDGKALVLRMFNPTGKKVGAEIKTRARIRAAHLLTLEELPVKKLAALGKSVKVSLAPKKIVTLKLDMDSV
ncbi:MAG TPA: glycoside hydrolase family 38 C-terminal domain-containing protein [Candidatus Hydrogenedentes bacterium]|nr:glycoside hydrolase family 38 C-terminal domain-containing protein [Candidatus Hydrogenedentota bacterium]